MLLGAISLIVMVVSGVIFFPSIHRDLVFSQQKNLTASEYLQQGLDAERQGNQAQAVWNFRQVLELQKDDRTALEHLPRLCLQTGQLNQALEYAQRLKALDSKSAIGSFYEGMAYSLLGQTDRAKASYEHAVELDPAYAEAYFNLGFIHESDGQLTRALEYYQKAVKADSKHARAYYNMGNAYAGLDNSDAAIEAYKAAVAIDPNYLDAFVNLSILLTRKGDYPQAIKYLDEARLLGYEAPELYLKTLEPYRALTK